MKVLRYIKKVVVAFIKICYLLLYKLIKVDEKVVVFLSFHGRGFSDNPRAIYECMKTDERFKDYTFVWFISNYKDKGISIEGAKVVEYMSLLYFYYLAKAKYWVFNCKMQEFIRKKNNQIYLQTWHGTPLKRLGHDISVDEDTTFSRTGMTYEQMCQSYDVDVARYDYMISPNRFCSEVFPSAFGVSKEKLIETGYPRNDFITNASKEDVLKIKERLNVPVDKKVILYAPTWRDNSYVAAGYTFELKADFYKWKELLGNEYVLVFKPHYLIINKYKDDEALKGFLYSIDATAEVNELYVISDILITDYSSVFFDYAVLNRPIYFYMYDFEDYRDQLRGFYLDVYTELPGKIYENEDMLLKAIVNKDYDFECLKTFNERFSHAQSGDCAKKVVDILTRHI